MKKISKMFAIILVGVVLLTSTVQAASYPGFNFTLGNTGTSYTHISNTFNQKTIISDPWTLKVKSITCEGSYGISFCPAKFSTSNGSITRICTGSAIWCHGTGYKTIAYKSGDAALTYYKLAARQDDDYIKTFATTGWYNADKVANK